MIQTENLQKIFRTDEVETWALNEVNIRINEGEFVAVMGPSGCGKTSCSTSWGCSTTPPRAITSTDRRLKFTESQRTGLRKGVIGFVFQSFNLIEELNVYENIELPLLYMKIGAAERKRA